jgi:Amt family ammonium transporter
MQLGFAMLCAGSIRSKNANNVLLWNMLDSCIAGIAYWAIGYAFAYGGDYNTTFNPQKTFAGTENFFLKGTVPLGFWFYQFAFTSAISSIVAGTIAERTQMRAYLLYSAMLAGFVYPVVSASID